MRRNATILLLLVGFLGTTIVHLIVSQRPLYFNRPQESTSLLETYKVKMTAGVTPTTTRPTHSVEITAPVPKLPPVYTSGDMKEMYNLSGPDITIPMIIHQTWKNETIPGYFEKYVKLWLLKNPSWKYWFWTDEDAENLVQAKYSDYYSLYQSYPRNIFRADAMRYFVLHEFGGFYADLDVENLKSLGPLIHRHHCIVAQEPLPHSALIWHDDRLAGNALMASRPRHPFFRMVIESLPLYRNETKDAPLNNTGPLMLDHVMHAYAKVLKSSVYTSIDTLFLAEPELFMPTFDPRMYKGYCRHRRKPHLARRICIELRRGGKKYHVTEKSYTDHKWIHTYDKRYKKPTDTPGSIFKFVPGAQRAGDILKELQITNRWFTTNRG